MPLTRREVTRATAAALGASCAGPLAAQPTSSPPKPRTFVLVHGAWHGGWCWRRVVDRLRAVGHAVFTPTLSGLGENSHRLDATIDLSTHVRDVLGAMEWNDLTDVILVGHSYAGFVITGVAALTQEVDSIVFLDAFLPQSKQSLADLASQAVGETIRSAAERKEISMKPLPAAYFNVNEADRAWVDQRCTAQPLATLTQPLPSSAERDLIRQKAYIRARGFGSAAFDQAYEQCRRAAGWRCYEVNSGHDVMIDAPDELARILEEVATT